MTAPPEAGGARAIALVRHGLLALTVVVILATAYELATERHWNDLVQLVPWFALGVLAVATALVLLPGGRGTTAARVLAVLVLGASLYGVLEHLLTNVGAGPLDRRFADSWDSVPLLQRAWYAVTKTVGPAPPLAPGVMGQGALLLILATFLPAGRLRRPRA